MPAVKGVLSNLRSLTATECAARDVEANTHTNIRPGSLGLVAVEKSNNKLWFYVACNDLPDRVCNICNDGTEMAIELCTRDTRHNARDALFYRCGTFNLYPLYSQAQALAEINGPNPPDYFEYEYKGP